MAGQRPLAQDPVREVQSEEAAPHLTETPREAAAGELVALPHVFSYSDREAWQQEAGWAVPQHASWHRGRHCLVLEQVPANSGTSL